MQQQSSHPSVTVVVPCYNAEHFIHETLQSVLRQTLSPLEVLVIDDGSTDRSSQIVQQFGSPVRLIRQRNQGESVARNRGMDEARGEWIAFLDADDIWKPEKTQRQLEAVSANSIGSVSNSITFYPDGTKDAAPEWKDSVAQMNSLDYIARRNAFLPSALILRSSVKSRFPDWTQHGEDFIFSMDVASEGCIDFLDEPLLLRRIHQQNQSAHPEMTAWHAQSFLRWLEMRRESLCPNDLSRIETNHTEFLIDRCELARYRRAWVEHKAIRTVLKQWGQVPAVAAYLSKPVLPKFAYRVTDWTRALLGR